MGTESTESPASSFPRQFGKYHLLAPLAQGGMGALYIAATGDRGLERLLVIKTVLPHLADDEYVSRFRDEAKVVVQLSHQNLIQVFDAGQVNGELFLAMDFIEGKDLRAIWNRCAKKAVAFPLDVAAFVVKELCRGLGYAHSHGDLGVVHRDVSPPNVIVSYNGEVKLTDFGLAASTLKLEKTAPGIVYGKVSYMSPEQARGEALDGRSDLYAAGIILWELLTGRQLFPASADQGQDLLDRSANPVVPLPSTRAPRVTKELDAICARALSPKSGDRYPNGEALREALGNWLAKHHPSTDAARVERFLGKLFDDDIGAERQLRSELLATTRERVLTLPPSHELRKLFGQIDVDELDRRSGEGPNLGRRAVDDGEEKVDRRQVGGRRAVDKITEGVGTMLGLQGSSASPSAGAGAGGEALASAEEIVLLAPKTEADADRMIGSILDGRYRIDELLGEGGMGRVYSGEHVEIGRTVAIKVLHAVYSNMPDLVERFRREARAATKIGHPNIVDVTDSGTTSDGSTYFVMEYLDGIELGSVIDKEGALEVGRAISIATQICRALAAAHAVDIIHRDLKPENVFLTTRQGVSDFVKVLDFGIAKTGEAEKARERRLTSPGVAMGTPEYMAPEQAAGKPADERSDIYALGAILYEMLSGLPPYEGDNFMAILSKKATTEPPSLKSLRSDVPAVISDLVSQAMSRDPALRPRSMESLEYELTKLASGRGAAVANAIGLSSEIAASEPVTHRTNPPELSASPSTRAETPAARVEAANNEDASDASGSRASMAEASEVAASGQDTRDMEDAETEIRDPAIVAAAALDSDPVRAAPLPFRSDEDDSEAARVAARAPLAPRATAPLTTPGATPVDAGMSEDAGARGAQTAATRSSRAGWIALICVLLLFGGGVFYVAVIEADRGKRPPDRPTRGAALLDAGVVPVEITGGDASANPMGRDAGTLAADAKEIDPLKDPTIDPTIDPTPNATSNPNKTNPPIDRNGKAISGKEPEVLLREGNAALNSGKYGLARRKFLEVLALKGSKAKANLGLARVAFNSGKFKDAISYGTKAGASTRALTVVGNSYEKLGDCPKALTYYRRIAQKNPTSTSASDAIKRCAGN